MEEVMEIDDKHKKLIETAFQKLNGAGTFVRTPLRFTLGSVQKLEPVFEYCFRRYDTTVVDFHWLPEYKEVIEWMADNKGKGLFMTGDYGRGKTNIILGVIKVVMLAQGMSMPGFHASQLPSKLSAEEWNFQKYNNWTLSYIDELGSERMVNEYGEKFEAFSEIISNAEQKLNVLVISSNLSGPQFLERYGDRSMDRISRLCKIVEFKGPSLRK